MEVKGFTVMETSPAPKMKLATRTRQHEAFEALDACARLLEQGKDAGALASAVDVVNMIAAKADLNGYATL